MLIFFALAALAYGCASFAFGAGSDPASSRRWGRGILGAAAFLHLGTIGGQCVEGNHPFASVFLVTSLIVFLTVLGYLALSARGRQMRALGAILGPIGLLGLTLGVWLGPGAHAEPDLSSRLLVVVHVASAALGVVGFGLSAGVAGLYLALDRRLRRKKFRPSEASGGLSLRGLERLHHWLVLAALPVFSVAIIAGVLVLRGSDAQIFETRGLELIAAGVAWLASVVTATARVAWGVRGRRAAWLSIVAFASMILILVSYGLRG